MTSTELTQVEATALDECEVVIERGIKRFIEVGNALAKIRDERLYRTTHGTFEEYCQQRWSLTRQHVNRMIAASGVAEALEPTGSKLNERQARELTGLSPDDARDVYEIAKGGAMVQRGKPDPTAADLREARKAWESPPETPDEILDAEIVDEEVAPGLTSSELAALQPKPKRSPLPDQVEKHVHALRAATDALVKDLEDDRFCGNTDVIVARVRAEFNLALEQLNRFHEALYRKSKPRAV